MKTDQRLFKAKDIQKIEELGKEISYLSEESLCIAFFEEGISDCHQFLSFLSKTYPKCQVVGCSTAGHIADQLIYDNEIVLTFLKFDKAKFEVALFDQMSPDNSFEKGEELALYGVKSQFTSTMIFSDGLNVNGSKLADGIQSKNTGLKFFGGLAGDSTRFQQTHVFYKGNLYQNAIVAIYFNQNVKCETQVGGGWHAFGVERTVTKSTNNVVYEIDDRPALKLYDDYLGEKANLLPAHGLHFPLSLFQDGEETTRTLLAINREEGSLTYAGDVKSGTKIKLMKSNSEDLIKGANDASARIFDRGINKETDLVMLSVSCVGRRLVLNQDTEAECEIDVKLQNKIVTTGFYSYGEIAKGVFHDKCELHNQTFTTTLIWEE